MKILQIKTQAILKKNTQKKLATNSDKFADFVLIPTQHTEDAQLLKQYANNKKIRIEDGTTCLPQDAFSHSNINEVIFPNSLSRIGYNCFKNSNISHIKLPESLKVVETNCFSHCNNLTNITFNNGLEKIMPCAFAECFSLTSIDLPNSVQEICDQAFQGCFNLTNVNFPQNLKTIKICAFGSCFHLFNVQLPDGVERVEQNAFESCATLNSVFLPDSVKYLGRACFYKCESLKYIHLPGSIKEIEESLFSNCSGLSSINIPDSVEVIKNFAFAKCRSLTYIHMPSSLTSIEQNAFNSCIHLNEIIIPENVTNVGSNAFFNCSNLTKVKILSKNISFAQDAFEATSFNYIVLHKDGTKTLCNNLTENFLNGDTVLDLKKINYRKLANLTTLLSLNNDTCKKIFKTIQKNNIYLSADFIKFLEKENMLDKYITEKRFIKFAKLQHKLPKYLPNNKIDFTFHNGEKWDKAFEKLCFTLGVFEQKQSYYLISTKQKEIDFSILSSSFLSKQLQSFEEDNVKFANTYGTIVLKPFNPDLAKFILSKKPKIKKEDKEDTTSIYEQLVQEELLTPGFIAKLINNFENIAQFSQSNSGAHQQTTPSLNYLKAQVKGHMYGNVSNNTQQLASFLQKYNYNDYEFNLACDILEEQAKLNPCHHLLGKKLSRTIDIEEIEKDNIYSTLSYEWLDKYSYENLVIGKHCNCCAHIGNAFGYGIIRASMVDEHVQNIVIRNKNNEIIAKACVSLDNNLGHMLLNTIIVSRKVPTTMKKHVHNTLMSGINDFVEKYNQENVNNKIIKVNVGAKNNGLIDEMKFYHHKADELLEGIDYHHYSKQKSMHYISDSKYEQYTILEDTEKEL